MRIELQPYTEISKYLETNDTILMPIGALEQYGPHLAIGTEPVSYTHLTLPTIYSV